MGSEQFTLGHMPPSLSLDVWSGRNYLLATNPDICDVQYSPLVLDLTGAGFTLTSPENGVYFDLNDSGTAVRTGWTAANNLAFLVRDINHNGMIDNGGELFGSATMLKNGKRAANGFEALKDLDDNGDGMFSPQDSAWSEVKLWIDENHDGITQPNELYSLDQMGIQSISLSYAGVNEVDPFGNQTRERSTFQINRRGKAMVGMIIDIWFNTLASLPTASNQ